MTCLIICSVAEAVHVGTVIVELFVVTVVAKFNALPNQFTLLPTVIPALSIIVPTNMESAPRVVAFGVQNTSQELAPFVNKIVEFALVFSAPLTLKIYVPAPLSVIVPPHPISAAHHTQYTPGSYTPIAP